MLRCSGSSYEITLGTAVPRVISGPPAIFASAMPKTDSTGWELSHWAGPAAQLVEAVQLAITKVTALAPYPQDFDPEGHGTSYDAAGHSAWRAAKAAAELSISVKEQDGYSSELAGVDELADLPERSFDSIRSIAIVVGVGLYSAPAVAFRLSRDAGLSVEIRGYERAWTAGLRHELETILRPALSSHAPLMRTGAHAAAIVIILPQLVFYAVIAGIGTLDVDGPARNAISLGSLAAVQCLVALVWFASSRRFELLRPGQPPRYQRWRKRLLAAAGTVCLGVIASVITAQLV